MYIPAAAERRHQRRRQKRGQQPPRNFEVDKAILNLLI
jgi:hypothetical protein